MKSRKSPSARRTNAWTNASIVNFVIPRSKNRLFRVLASPLAGLYVDVLDALEREAAQSTHGLDRTEAIGLVQQILEQHNEIADLPDEDSMAAPSANGKARAILETLRKAVWKTEQKRSDTRT